MTNEQSDIEDLQGRIGTAEARIATLERSASDSAEFETRKHDFIRAAVLAMIANGSRWESPRTPWELARALWDEKPEDC